MTQSPPAETGARGIVTLPSANSLVIKRIFRTTPEAMWDAWATPEEICLWMGPDSIERCEALAFDFREGGGYRIRMFPRDGSGPHTVGGRYRKIDKPGHLSFSWAWEEDNMPLSLVDVAIRTVGAGVELTLTHTEFPTSDARDRHVEGWQGCFDKLDGLAPASDA
ncbi:MAG: SRPBCC domain-containing protein [Hyphomonas sp.]